MTMNFKTDRYQALTKIEENTVHIQKLNQQDTEKLAVAIYEIKGMIAHIKEQHEEDMTIIRNQKEKLTEVEVRLCAELSYWIDQSLSFPYH